MRTVNDLVNQFRTGLRVEWTVKGPGIRGTVLFWPEEQTGYVAKVMVIFDDQPFPIQVPASELTY